MTRKVFDRINHHFMIKVLKKLGIEGMYFNMIKPMYFKPITNNILYQKTLKPFLSKSGMRQQCPLYLLLFNIVLAILPRTIREEKEIKRI
jgi:hypothetical protein